MDEEVYKLLKLVGTSEKSIEEAINVALAKANNTIEELKWFKVVETRGDIQGGQVHRYQVVLEVGFKLHHANE
jgi:flavin-binding protein dodecin